MNTDRYTSPLSERYASKEMQYIFSQDKKFTTWRKLWIALAETEMELGLSENGKPVISQEQIDEMKAHVDEINYDVAKAREKLKITEMRIPSKGEIVRTDTAYPGEIVILPSDSVRLNDVLGDQTRLLGQPFPDGPAAGPIFSGNGDDRYVAHSVPPCLSCLQLAAGKFPAILNLTLSLGRITISPG